VMGLGQVKREWKTSTGEDRYRRGMYTFLFRATPHPLLNGFDAPDGQFSCTRRVRSNTPLQALTLLNDAAFVEFAQALAQKLVKNSGGAETTDASRIVMAFRACTARAPDASEAAVLTRLLTKQRAAFAADEKQAKEICGDRCPKDVKPAEFAAWTIVARAVLNLDETITRE
jgi:hypothetical protein